MTPQELRERTARFAVDVAKFTKTFEDEPAANIVIDQILRSATGMAANYRATGQARSHGEFTSRISVVLEEADECIHWLEFTERAGLASGTELDRLLRESRELTAIFGASRRTATANRKAHAANVRVERVERRRRPVRATMRRR
jgi:four helix bundle protein